jgi:hypothetical protein
MGQVLTEICHDSRLGVVGTSRCDVRDGQRSGGPSQGPRSSETPTLRCVSETAQRAVPTSGRKHPTLNIRRRTPKLEIRELFTRAMFSVDSRAPRARQSGGGPPHSRTLRVCGTIVLRASVLECASPLALGLMPRLANQRPHPKFHRPSSLVLPRSSWLTAGALCQSSGERAALRDPARGSLAPRQRAGVSESFGACLR